MRAILRLGTGLMRPSAERRRAVRFALGGAGVTLVGAAVYGLASGPARLPPLLANLLAFGTCVMIGYRLHGDWSFGDLVGRRDGAWRRYLVAALAGLTANSLWVWLLTGPLGAAAWWPILPMVALTPALTFAANRYWVFTDR